MKYSLRKSFSYRRRTDLHDDEHTNSRIENQIAANSNSNLVKKNQPKYFLRRHRRRCSSSPPPSPSSKQINSKTSQLPYNNHINDDDDDDDDPFTPPANVNARARPFDKLTYQIRKSFRNTLTRRSRLESTNSNKRLIANKNDENHPINPANASLSTSLTTPALSLSQTNSSNENEKVKAPSKRRKAPLAPNHINQSTSVPNADCASFRLSDLQESGYASSSNDQSQQQDLFNKKNKLNRSFRTRISLLLKKRHAKQQQQQHQQNHNSIDEDSIDRQCHDDHNENMNKKQTLTQRFDTIRRSFHLGSRNSTTKGKGYLLSNE